MTQKQLANKAGVSERLVRSLEMGSASGIGLEKLAAILSSLNLTMAVVDNEGSTSTMSSNVITQGVEYSEALARAVASWKPEVFDEGPA